MRLHIGEKIKFGKRSVNVASGIPERKRLLRRIEEIMHVLGEDIRPMKGGLKQLRLKHDCSSVTPTSPNRKPERSRRNVPR